MIRGHMEASIFLVLLVAPLLGAAALVPFRGVRGYARNVGVMVLICLGVLVLHALYVNLVVLRQAGSAGVGAVSVGVSELAVELGLVAFVSAGVWRVVHALSVRRRIR